MRHRKRWKRQSIWRILENFEGCSQRFCWKVGQRKNIRIWFWKLWRSLGLLKRLQRNHSERPWKNIRGCCPRMPWPTPAWRALFQSFCNGLNSCPIVRRRDPNFKSILCTVSQPKGKWRFPAEKHGGPPNAKQKHMQMGVGSFVIQLDLGPHAMTRISKFEVQFTLFHINAKRKAFTNPTFSAFFSRFVCQHPSTSCTRKKHKESTTGSGCATCGQISLFLPAFWLKQLTARYANGSVYDSAWAVGKLTKTDETQSHMCLCQQCGLWNPFQEFSIQTDAGFLERCVHV